MNHYRPAQFVENRLIDIRRTIAQLEASIKEIEREAATLPECRSELAEYRQIEAALVALAGGSADAS